MIVVPRMISLMLSKKTMKQFMRFVCKCFVLGLWVLFASIAHATSLKISAIGEGYVDVAHYVAIARDETGLLNVDELSADASRFSKLDTPYIDMRQTRGAYWVRVELTNDTARNGAWRFEVRRPYLLELDVYLASDRQIEPIISLGKNAPNRSRSIKSRYYNFDVSLDSKNEAVLFVRYRSFATGFLPLYVSKPESSRSIHHGEEQINWLFYGVLVTMIFFVSLLGRVVTWRISLSFSAYILFGGFFIFHADGYSAQYLWPEWAAPSDHINMLLAILMTLSALVFARNLFDTRTTHPRLDRLCRAFLFLLSTLFVVSFVSYGTRWFNALPYVAIFVTSLLHPLIGLAVLRKGADGALSYLCGTPFIVGSLVYSAGAHIFPGLYSVENTLNVGHLTLVIEALAFSIAILLRVLGIQRQRDKAMRSELEATTARAEMATELYKTQKRFEETKRLAAQHGKKLATYAHDILQPLVGLRSAMENAVGSNGLAQDQVSKSFDYLETLTKEQIETHVSTDGREDGQETFTIQSILDASVAMFKSEAANKGIVLQYEPSSATVTMNPVALMRMVNNLISNALKHTQEGEVIVGSQEFRQHSYIYIKNTPGGVEKNELSNMFADGQKGSGSQGFGLGLGIVKKLADGQGVEFTLESEEAGWTVATLKLPADTTS